MTVGSIWARGMLTSHGPADERNLLAADVHTFEAMTIIVTVIIYIVKSPFGTISPAFSKAHWNHSAIVKSLEEPSSPTSPTSRHPRHRASSIVCQLVRCLRSPEIGKIRTYLFIYIYIYIYIIHVYIYDYIWLYMYICIHIHNMNISIYIHMYV